MSLDIQFIDQVNSEGVMVFDANITHNLNVMANKAGIYYQLWRPDEIGATSPKDIVKELEAGLELLKRNRKAFELYEPDNKWGTYPQFVEFVEAVIVACHKYPNAKIKVSR